MKSNHIGACVVMLFLAGATAYAAGPAPVEAAGNNTTAADDAVSREIAGLIAQLGDEQFQVREAASAQLKSLGLRAYKAVRAAGRTAPEPEVRARLAEIEEALVANTLWNGKETVEDYAKRMEIRQTQRTLELGDKKVPLKLLLIPAGEFMMGSPENEDDRQGNETLHKVRISRSFMMGATAVTQAQWKAVMGTDPSGFKGDDLPVEMVSWKDATAFCAALNKAMPGEVFRQPTEAEWEYACRAGTRTAFNFGEKIDASQANYMAKEVFAGGHPPEFRSTTLPVASFKPNAWGLYDMHGNVWQWCSDWFAAYPGGDLTDPVGPAEGTTRSLRGGSWIDTWDFLRSGRREDSPPDRTTMHIGLRVVEELKE